MRLGLPLLVAALALLSAPALAAWETPVIHIAADGTVTVAVNGTVEPGLNAFPAPAPPVPATITALIDGEAVPVVYENGTIYVASDRAASASITYVVNVTQADGSLSFTIGNQTVKLVVEPNIVLLQLPRGLLAAEQAGGRLVLTVQGPDTIVYLVTQPRQTRAETATPTPTQTPTETQAPTPSPTATQPQQTQTQTPQQTAAATEAPAQTATETQTPQQTPTGAQQPTPQQPATQTQTGGVGALTLAAAALIVAAGAAAAVTLLRGRSRPGAVRGPGEAQALMTRGLDDVDRLILETLERNGGEMLQSELMRATGLPKTTLWRHVRRLAEQGYIEIIREGKANRLRLRRKP